MLAALPDTFAVATDDLLKLGLATLAGALIGAEREYRDRAAGFRTIIFICVGAALFTIVSHKIALAHDRALRLLLVSNEVGMGVVPATPLGRRFQDILGRLNQVVGHHADDAVFMMAGIPIDLRRIESGVQT